MMSKYDQDHIGWYLRFDSHTTAKQVMKTHVHSAQTRLRIAHQPADVQMKNPNFEYQEDATKKAIVGSNVLRVTCDQGVTEELLRGEMMLRADTSNLIMSLLCQEHNGTKAVELLGNKNLGWSANRQYRIIRKVFLVRCVDAAAARCMMRDILQGMRVNGYPIDAQQYSDEYCVKV